MNRDELIARAWLVAFCLVVIVVVLMTGCKPKPRPLVEERMFRMEEGQLLYFNDASNTCLCDCGPGGKDGGR